MKPWHAPQDSRSDFAATATGAPPLDATPSAALALARGVGSLGAATVLLAFTEACLHLEQRPIPLRFAARYAAVNVVPSAVWKTVPVQYVAAASNLPATRLVTAAAAHGEPNLAVTPRRANRLIAIQSLRSVRYAVASYGLVWTLWRWHETQQPVDEDSAKAKAPIPAARAERVVRLTPAGSSLSVATTHRHGEHVIQIPWHDVRRGDPIDWSTIRLDETWRKDDDGSDASGSGVKALELEIDGEHEDAAAFMVAKRAASGAGGGVRTVALVDAAAAPVWRSRGNGADVYFFALSGIVRFLSEHCDPENGERLVLVACDEGDDHAVERSRRLLSFVNRAMVHRAGVPTVVGLDQLSVDEHEEEDDEQLDALRRPPAMVAVFAASVDSAIKQVDEIVQSGRSSLNRIVVVVDKSAATLPALLARCDGVLSVADLSDSVLQRIRVQLRAGASPESIQHTIFEEFGEQSALLYRADAASDTTKYI